MTETNCKRLPQLACVTRKTRPKIRLRSTHSRCPVASLSLSLSLCVCVFLCFSLSLSLLITWHQEPTPKSTLQMVQGPLFAHTSVSRERLILTLTEYEYTSKNKREKERERERERHSVNFHKRRTNGSIFTQLKRMNCND